MSRPNYLVLSGRLGDDPSLRPDGGEMFFPLCYQYKPPNSFRHWFPCYIKGASLEASREIYRKGDLVTIEASLYNNRKGLHLRVFRMFLLCPSSKSEPREFPDAPILIEEEPAPF